MVIIQFYFQCAQMAMNNMSISGGLTLVESIHANLAFFSGISRSLKNFSRADIIFTTDMWVPTTSLISIKPINFPVHFKCCIQCELLNWCDVLCFITGKCKFVTLHGRMKWLLNKLGHIINVLTSIFWRYICRVFRCHY